MPRTVAGNRNSGTLAAEFFPPIIRRMLNGFLGYQTTFMLDVVVCALVLVVPLLAWSLYVVRVQRRYQLHKRLQLILAVLLLIAVAGFEIDVQLVHGGWEAIVNPPGQPPRLDGEALDHVRTVLWIHLAFAISTPPLWIATIWLALRRYPSPPKPGPHSPLHKRLGWIATLDLLGTSLTGLWFYYVAFVAV